MRTGDLGFELIIFLGCLGLVFWLWPHPVLLTLCLAAVSLVVLLQRHRQRELSYFVTAFIFGPMAEVIASASGAWSYATPFFPTGIPLWLPFLWGIAFLQLMKISETIGGKH